MQSPAARTTNRAAAPGGQARPSDPGGGGRPGTEYAYAKDKVSVELNRGLRRPNLCSLQPHPARSSGRENGPNPRGLGLPPTLTRSPSTGLSPNPHRVLARAPRDRHSTCLRRVHPNPAGTAGNPGVAFGSAPRRVRPCPLVQCKPAAGSARGPRWNGPRLRLGSWPEHRNPARRFRQRAARSSRAASRPPHSRPLVSPFNPLPCIL